MKFLPLRKSLFLKLLKSRMLKKTIWASKRNETLIMKSVGLDLALIIGVDFNLTTLRKDNVSRPCSPRATLVNFKIIISRDLIRRRGTGRYVPVITAARRAI